MDTITEQKFSFRTVTSSALLSLLLGTSVFSMDQQIPEVHLDSIRAKFKNTMDLELYPHEVRPAAQDWFYNKIPAPQIKQNILNARAQVAEVQAAQIEKIAQQERDIQEQILQQARAAQQAHVVEEARRVEAERQRVAAEEARAEEERQRIAAEARAEEERQRIAAEARAELERQRIAAEAEARRVEEERQRIAAEAEARRVEEERQRIAAEARAEEESPLWVFKGGEIICEAKTCSNSEKDQQLNEQKRLGEAAQTVKNDYSRFIWEYKQQLAREQSSWFSEGSQNYKCTSLADKEQHAREYLLRFAQEVKISNIKEALIQEEDKLVVKDKAIEKDEEFREGWRWSDFEKKTSVLNNIDENKTPVKNEKSSAQTQNKPKPINQPRVLREINSNNQNPVKKTSNSKKKTIGLNRGNDNKENSYS